MVDDVNKGSIDKCNLSVPSEAPSYPCQSDTELGNQESEEHVHGRKILFGQGESRQKVNVQGAYDSDERSMKKLSCPVVKCGRTFVRLAALRTHLTQHEERDEKTKMRFAKETKHTRGKLRTRIAGPLEDTLVSREQLLRRGRKYECNICSKRFVKPCLLQRHTVLHTCAKPFQCTNCSKCFTQKASLQRHFQHNHICKNSHKCSKCDRCFSQKTNLLRHLKRAHVLASSESYYAENRFACDRCSCVYSKLNSLNRHKTLYHPAIESETARIAQLAVTYQDETPVEDADELARSVLAELIKLQGGMMPALQPLKVEQHVHTNQRSINNNETITETAKAIEDPSKIYLVEICDRLNPQFEPHVITVQCIRRSDGIAYYVCEFCAKEFRKTYDLLRHRRVHMQETPYKCEQCSRCCITKSKLEEHKKVHTSTDMPLPCKHYICSICQQVFDSIRQLDTHANLHAETHTLFYACSICDRSYGTLAAFSKHKHRKRDKELEMISNLLPKAIDVSTKGSQKSVDLPACNSATKMLTGHKCFTCERLFTTQNQLTLHYKIHSTHKQFVCPKCTLKKFPTASRLRRHMLSHTNQRNFKCVYCDKTFKSKENCRQHMQMHLKLLLKEAEAEPSLRSELTPKKCLVVVQQKKQAASQTGIQALLQQVPKFFELQMLPKYRRLKQHKNITIKNMPSAATTAQVNTCSFCQRQFKKPSDLQRHLRTHTKERPFNCNLCAKSFALQSTLKEHCLTHVQQRITYDCQVCGKSYASKKVLVLHLRIHTGERPFKCHYCEMTFRTSGHRQAHIKVAHKQ